MRGRLLQPGFHAGAHAWPLAQPVAAWMDHTFHLPLLFFKAEAGLDLSRKSYLLLCHLTGGAGSFFGLSRVQPKNEKAGSTGPVARVAWQI